MSNLCSVFGCHAVSNKPLGTTIHPFPTSTEMRKQWSLVLRNRCSNIDFQKNKVCSKHFDPICFNVWGQLKDNAVPSIFPVTCHIPVTSTLEKNLQAHLRSLSQAQLAEDISKSLKSIKEPLNLNHYITKEFNCNPSASLEAKMWLLIKKQAHFNNLLMEAISEKENQVQELKNKMNEQNDNAKEMESNVETYKYLAKCLQEKQITLEEQIEILTTLETK